MTDAKELERKVNVLWKILRICPNCQENAMVPSPCLVYPPQYHCPACTVPTRGPPGPMTLAASLQSDSKASGAVDGPTLASPVNDSKR